MAEALIDLDLGPKGGKIRLKDVERLEKWIANERSNWEWLLTLGDGGDPGTISTHTINLFNNLDAVVWRIRSGLSTPAVARSELAQFFTGDPAPYYLSTSDIGQAILALREQMGPQAAALAYSLFSGVVGYEPRRADHKRLMMLIAFPELITGEARRQAAKASYRSLVSELQAVVERHKDQIAELDAEAAKSLTGATERARSSYRRALANYAKARKRGWKKTQSAISSLEATEAAYVEKMSLKAAVSYWETKETGHANEEVTRSGVLLNFARNSAIFGGLAVFVLFLALLEMSGVNSLPWVDLTPEGNKPLPATAFFIIAATLGSVLTGIIWAARIMVRNYQTERHLKRDAQERRVMTMTYLALINEGGALADEDRLVILNALFRQSSDGLPRDDGPQEVALPALIAKLIDKK